MVIVAAALVVFGCGTGVLVMVVGGSFPMLTSAAIVITIVLGIATVGVGAAGLHRRDVEARAGYTTAPHAFVNLATVDHQTGFVLREPGEPLLSDEQYRQRRAAAVRGGAT
ncbi:hypothetical protein [Protaetiibacter larvae]|uniref:Uncharacterized protein n=1 Tax=Protaetiibacter larvae TaxID=2592654 RepID=A0A5C1Y5K2_9MICO|nr:hypothetical protein [Protaetiibacter larvae]QEO08599.1 hypothetical protein FLP23_00270 [Protaetiibacter larvae]